MGTLRYSGTPVLTPHFPISHCSCTPWFRHPIVPTLHEHCSNYKFSIKYIQCQRNLLIMFKCEGVAGTEKKGREFSKLPTKIKKGPFLSTIALLCRPLILPMVDWKIIISASMFRFGLWCLTPLSTIFPVISGRSVFLVEETGLSGENHRPAASHWQTLSHNVVSTIPRLSGVRTHNVSGDRYWLHR